MPAGRWDLQEDPESLSPEQNRLIFAMNAALIGMTLDGIVQLTYGTEGEKQAVANLAGVCRRCSHRRSGGYDGKVGTSGNPE